MREESPKSAGIFGATGLLGGLVATALAGRGWQLRGFRRRPGRDVAGINDWRETSRPDLGGLGTVINLAGEPVAQRWTRANRVRFSASRAGLTRDIVAALARLPPAERPHTLVNASAVGIYGDRGAELLDEDAAAGGDYLADLCSEWEEAARQAGELGTRVVCLRTGLVLAREATAWRRIERVFRLGLGGRLGHGRQWWPWIHGADFAAAVLHCLEDPTIHGPVNVVAPAPVTNAEFTRALARATRRPALLPVPGWLLKLALGGFGQALLASQRATPSQLLRHDFRFQHPTLASALHDLTAPR